MQKIEDLIYLAHMDLQGIQRMKGIVDVKDKDIDYAGVIQHLERTIRTIRGLCEEIGNPSYTHSVDSLTIVGLSATLQQVRDLAENAKE